MDNEKKPTLKIARGEVVKLKLSDKEPFSSGSNEYNGVDKKWFGYNAVSGSVEYVYFSTEPVHNLIVESGVGANEEFTLELRAVKNKDGQDRSIWYLNGRSIWDYQDDTTPQATSPSEPTQVESNGIKAVSDTIGDLIKRVEVLEGKANISNDQTAYKVDDDAIPF